MDPIALSHQIEERYKRYLLTTFYFRDPELRKSFEDALNSGRLSKGPYLESTPVFKRVETPAVLFHQLLEQSIDSRFLKALYEGPLYKHQADAIRQISAGKNVVVATGTGSGKTEAFIYPILLHLYQEFNVGKLCPGVRALILYPMNALANDQRERLGEICKRLADANSPFRFTFGQYIGETPDDESDSRRNAKDLLAERDKKGVRQIRNGKVVNGEMVLRSEMRQDPPHILLTNYSMLEYLLLRPDDSSLFDNGMAQWWTYLVLDEAHQYRGSRGIEMAMLVSRLKQRLREGGRQEPFRCIATSATLVDGENGKDAVAKFASDLFGEKFDAHAVIMGESEPRPESSSEQLAVEDYQFLANALDEKAQSTTERLDGLAHKLRLSLPAGDRSTVQVARLLQRDNRTARLRDLITANALQVQEIADRIFDDLDSERRISALALQVDLLLHSHIPGTETPLLSARYHLFLRSLEGAFLSYIPQKRISLDRNAVGEGIAFEIALCKQCGQHYLVAQKGIQGGRVLEPTRDASQDSFGSTFLRPIENDSDSVESDDEQDNDDADAPRQSWQLCVRCGEISKKGLRCGHDDMIFVIPEESGKDDKADQIRKCGVCGYYAAGRNPVQEVVFGADGPHVVIATTLHKNLPDKRRKVLAFADGRQEAAYFAWYLQESYREILDRNVILRIARGVDNFPSAGVSLTALADRAYQNHLGYFKQKLSDDELTVRKNVWRALYHELLADDSWVALEGVGLVRWSIQRPDWLAVTPILLESPWSLTEAEARDLEFLLLDTMRTTSWAVQVNTPSGISLNWSDLHIIPFQKQFQLQKPKGRNDVQSWAGGRTKRTQILTRLLGVKSSGAEAQDLAVRTLRHIWDNLTQCDQHAPSEQERLLVPVKDARRLNPDWYRLHLVNPQDTFFRCNICGRLQTVSVRGICAGHRCPGTLEKTIVADLEPDHYRLLYEEELPSRLRVEEHTAQLDHERARAFQRDFRENKIDVLSCSTTFELGVDLGDLDTAFLRNVPPESFNYAQRVGRVGRRSGYPGFAITYCRRNPHDLYHFERPERMLSGKVRPPALSLQNEKIIARHITATGLSAFFRNSPERFKTVETFCMQFEKPSGVIDFKTYLTHHKNGLEQSLRAIVPANMSARMGLNDGSWIAKITDQGSRIAEAEEVTADDYRKVNEFEEKSRQEGTREGYGNAIWASDRARTIAGEEVLTFLSRKAIIPKYGFPVDVVELDTHQTKNAHENYGVALQRDLTIAIAEFAPTSELVANKKVWTSYGLKKVAEKEWARWWYARCATHGYFDRKPYREGEGQPAFEKHSGCDRMKVYQYIEPQFGFVTNREKPKEPTGRPVRVFTTRPYFSGFKEGHEGERMDWGVVSVTNVSPGYMVVLSEGRGGSGFFVCGQCGAGFRNRKDFQKGHETPYAEKCLVRAESLSQVSLGHELLTDVLKLQFQHQPQIIVDSTWLAFSLAYALVEGAAERLEVPTTDLNATVAYGGEKYLLPPIVLYDNVPGGAGLVARLENKDIFKACLETALKHVSGDCGCADNTSCYGCLRNYRNQFAHPYLQRGAVAKYLTELLASW